jgi:hypothetical protein
LGHYRNRIDPSDTYASRKHFARRAVSPNMAR